MAALSMMQELSRHAPEATLGVHHEIVACPVSLDVLDRVLDGTADAAVLPIENSLHGSVAEHYDLLLTKPVRIAAETRMRIRHNVIALPGVPLEDVRAILSHPVALSQCRRWFQTHPDVEAVPFYDTAGGVKHVMAKALRHTAAIAPPLAAEVYGAAVLLSGVEDHVANFTRFHLLLRADQLPELGPPNKLSLAFAVDHRPGTLVAALERLAGAGVNLTKIESRPVPGRPWEYIFYVDIRFRLEEELAAALDGLARHTSMLRELGRYQAAEGE